MEQSLLLQLCLNMIGLSFETIWCGHAFECFVTCPALQARPPSSGSRRSSMALLFCSSGLMSHYNL